MAPRKSKTKNTEVPDVEPNPKRVTGLLEERRGYINRGLDDRVAECDAQIEVYGGADIAAGHDPDGAGDPVGSDDQVNEGGEG